MKMSGKSQNYFTIDELKNSLCKDARSLTLVRSPRPIKLAAFIILFGFFLLAMLLVFAPWVQTVEGVGRVIAYAPNQRQQFLEAPVDGKIDTWHVREGQTVKKGDPIVDIAPSNNSILESKIENWVQKRTSVTDDSTLKITEDGTLAAVSIPGFPGIGFLSFKK